MEYAMYTGDMKGWKELYLINGGGLAPILPLTTEVVLCEDKEYHPGLEPVVVR